MNEWQIDIYTDFGKELYSGQWILIKSRNGSNEIQHCFSLEVCSLEIALSTATYIISTRVLHLLLTKGVYQKFTQDVPLIYVVLKNDNLSKNIAEGLINL